MIAVAAGIVVELVLWYRRVATRQSAQLGRPGPLELALAQHPILVMLVLVIGWLFIYACRFANALRRFAWHWIIKPDIEHARLQWRIRKAAKLEAQARYLIEHGATPRAVTTGAALLDRARHAHRPPPPAPPALPPVDQRPVALPVGHGRGQEVAPVALEVAEAGPVDLSIVHGLVTSYADGRHVFEPMEVRQP